MQNRYKFVGKKGSGTFSTVIKAERVKDGRLVAIKKLKQKFPTIEDVEFFREIQALRRLGSNPNIVHLIEIIYNPNNGQLSLVFELMSMNLYEWLKIQRTYLLRPVAKHIITEIIKSVAFCHSKGIFHRDLKPENVLVRCENPGPNSSNIEGIENGNSNVNHPNILNNDYESEKIKFERLQIQENKTNSEFKTHSQSIVNSVTDVSSIIIKLADFGSCRGCYARTPLTEYVATRWYRSPECILSDGQYGPSMDYWAVGVVAAEVLCLEPLFPGKDERDMINRIIKMITGGFSRGKFPVSRNQSSMSLRTKKYTGGMYPAEWNECIYGQKYHDPRSEYWDLYGENEHRENNDDRDKSLNPNGIRNPLSENGVPYFDGWVDSSFDKESLVPDGHLANRIPKIDSPTFRSTYYGPHIPHYDTFYSNLEIIMPKIANYDENVRKKDYGTIYILPPDTPGYSVSTKGSWSKDPDANIPPVLEFDFLIRLMALSPKDRMSIDDALKHPYIGLSKYGYVRPKWTPIQPHMDSPRFFNQGTLARFHSFSTNNLFNCLTDKEKNKYDSRNPERNNVDDINSLSVPHLSVSFSESDLVNYNLVAENKENSRTNEGSKYNNKNTNKINAKDLKNNCKCSTRFPDIILKSKDESKSSSCNSVVSFSSPNYKVNIPINNQNDNVGLFKYTFHSQTGKSFKIKKILKEESSKNLNLSPRKTVETQKSLSNIKKTQKKDYLSPKSVKFSTPSISVGESEGTISKEYEYIEDPANRENKRNSLIEDSYTRRRDISRSKGRETESSVKMESDEEVTKSDETQAVTEDQINDDKKRLLVVPLDNASATFDEPTESIEDTQSPKMTDRSTESDDGTEVNDFTSGNPNLDDDRAESKKLYLPLTSSRLNATKKKKEVI